MTNTNNTDQNKKFAMAAYVLYFISFFFPISAIAAIIINFIKRPETAGTWIESHHRWMIRTFLFAVMWAMIAAGMYVIPGLGIILMVSLVLITSLWMVYRLVRGVLALANEQPMYASTQTTAEQTTAERLGNESA